MSKHLVHSDIFTKDDLEYRIKIELGDPCNNGHSDFSITTDIFEKNRYVMGGCCHEEILKVRPEYEIFVRLHLCDFRGAPMYPVDNGIYIIKNESIEAAAEYLRCSLKEIEILRDYVEDKEAFIYMLNQLGIVRRWKEEADIAITKLKELTGKKFEPIKKRLTKITLTQEEQERVEKLIRSGYFTKKNIRKRKLQGMQKEKERLLQELEEKRQQELQAIEREYEIKRRIISYNPSIKNWIYYSHSNTVNFNWESYEKPVSLKDIQNIGYLLSDLDVKITIGGEDND
ncbi:MAG: hypothetical protein ACP6IQ_01890 [Candidatus Njordarchaeia archaeon]